jgi:hypothetical protein
MKQNDIYNIINMIGDNDTKIDDIIDGDWWTIWHIIDGYRWYNIIIDNSTIIIP